MIKLQPEDGKGHNSIHTIRGVLRPAFQMAVDDDLLKKNPFSFSFGILIVNDSEKREAVTTELKIIFLVFVRRDKHYMGDEYGCSHIRTLSMMYKNSLIFGVIVILLNV